ncbi:ImmA/IrrE family metallo-endopeptidase [Paenibacillus odorifer]|uniref:IrrE N-terminal-like domain-containing protein n=1 Tax=Paenibacillus odorifer TaxID=189426 RepID=A0A1R0Y7Y9_9BACL|nr:ImmA/IrrE family metallo-endopeptidase [Paenibacillus odorifer]OMD43474.1 hypothetical protein BSK52_03430 [Paenibacillus odorifer]
MSVRTAVKRAEKLLSEYRVTAPPIDVESIAEKLSIDIQYEPFDGQLSGVLIRDKDTDTYVIGVNKKHPENRQRFTIAHEIGHFLLHEGHNTHIDTAITVNFRNSQSSNGTRNEEIEANAFAATLLMPEEILEEYIEENFDGFIDYNDDKQVQTIAEDFGVSTQALMIRLGKLNWFE